jgi:hypothetical protein
MNLREKCQFEIFALFRCRLLRGGTTQALVPLLVGFYRSGGRTSSTVAIELDSDHLGLLRLFTILSSASASTRLVCSGGSASRAAGHSTSTNASILSYGRVDAVDDLCLSALLSWDVLHIVSLVDGFSLLVVELLYMDNCLRRLD